jgi:circadian clock protein KaiC
VRSASRSEEVEALDQSAQEFATRVKAEVEEHGTRIVMIDGIAGYRMTLHQSGEQVLKHLHALGRYLKGKGVTAIFVDEITDITGTFHATQDSISYLADSIVFLRHIELDGELQKAIGVLKKRTGNYERTLRQFEITDSGIRVGEPLTDLRGVLSGTPVAVSPDGG